ncbi:AI-2E family transporter [Natrialba sp. PRR66]|uniref:AI-2E family transporter n=1 Tax=Natrialba sp. PRR66 TaxID=3098146 RepID=UPI002B1DC359|nr:AI-2E family transporter [Natrialba sp. PRR66]
MADRPPSGEWFARRPGLTVLAIVAAVLGLLVILPYLQYVLLGVVLAYILVPAQRWLEQYVSSLIAALSLVAVTILALLLPLAYVLTVAFREALNLVDVIQDGNGNLDVTIIESQLENVGYSVDLVEFYQTYQDPIATGLQGLAMSAVEIAGGAPGLFIGLTVTVFVLFALLRDGGEFVVWMQRVVPIEDDLLAELLAELDQLMWASVVGNVAVAIIQAVLLGIGLAVLGVPAVVLLSVVTFIFALLPLIGAFGVWVPVSIGLLATGQLVSAAILIVYGSIVSASDTYIRPALIGRTSAFNSAIIVVGIFGGLVVFGAVGLFIGPVVLGGAKITLDLFARERADAPQPVTGTATPGADSAVQTEPETGLAGEQPPESELDVDEGGDTETNADEATAGVDGDEATECEYDGSPDESDESDETDGADETGETGETNETDGTDGNRDTSDETATDTDSELDR